MRFALAEKKRSVVALQQTSLLLRGFWRKRDSPYSENGRVYSHSGACNGEFGGVAVSRNQVMIVRENLSVEATKNPTETSGFFGGNESRDVELYAFNEEAKYLLALPLF